MKFVVLTDTHFVAPGRRLYALDPAARLSAAVETINCDHPDIAFVIVAGDLAHWGDLAAYQALQESLAALHAPVISMMGNHDRRAPFRATFTDADDDGNGFVQSARRFDAATVITLDTLAEDQNTHAGRLCAARLGFMERALRQAPADRPVLLFQHHPPLALGLPHMDPIMLQDSEQEWQVFRRSRAPDFMFFGHIHRPVSGRWRGIPFHIQRAVSHQVAFDLTISAYVPGTHEPPDYALVTVNGGDIVILQRSFLYDGPTFSLDDAAADAAGPRDRPSC